MTNKQREILDLLKNNIGHYSAEDIFLMAKKNKIDVSLASIYRILNKLVEEKLIKKISNIEEDKDIYEIVCEEHQHLVCSKCGKIMDIKIKDIKKSLEKQTGVKIDSYDLCMHYVCKKCQKTNKA